MDNACRRNRKGKGILRATVPLQGKIKHIRHI